MSEIEEKLKSEISRIENEIKEKDLKIARMEGYSDGTKDGFEMAKQMVIDKLSKLPEVKLNEISLNHFFTELTKFVYEVKTLNIKYGNNS